MKGRVRGVGLERSGNKGEREGEGGRVGVERSGNKGETEGEEDCKKVDGAGCMQAAEPAGGEVC